MSLAVIIPYYNGSEYIDQCLESLESYDASSIFIVDNSEIRNLKTKKATVIKHPQHRVGFGAAVNFGLEEVYRKNFTHVLIHNQDAYYQKGHFAKLVKYLDDNPPKKFISPVVYTVDFAKVMPFISARYFQDLSPTNNLDIDDFVAVSLVVPVDLMKKLQGFDPSYFMYYEDNDLIARSKLIHPVRILADVHVAHENHEELGNSMSPEKQKWIAESELKYIWRHESKQLWLLKKIKFLINRSLGKYR